MGVWVEVVVLAGSVEVVVAVVAVIPGNAVVVLDPVEVAAMVLQVEDIVPGVAAGPSVLEGNWRVVGVCFSSPGTG